MKKVLFMLLSFGLIFTLAACEDKEQDTTEAKDRVAPILIGIYNVTITVGDTFDPMEGVTAEDNVDGDVTDKIEVSGTVDVDEPGEYLITYTVVDKAGNKRSLGRQIIVKEATQYGKLYNGDFSQGMDHWTTWFGDGGAGEVVVEDGVAKYTVTALGDEFWTSQFQQLDLAFEPGKYEVKFTAKADVARKMQVKVETSQAFADEIFDITTEEQEFTVEFEMTDTITGVKLGFFLGLINGDQEASALTTVYIKNVSLTKK